MGRIIGKGVCEDCEFCFPHGDGFVCADVHYGKDITEELSEIKDCYSEGFEAFVRRCEANRKK